jgi:excisionase family DNA binding protein
MGAAEKPKELFTASEVARFCQVDLKTIHNWAERGELDHFRTPGRHLRFRRSDVLDFLRRYGYPIPVTLVRERAMVTVIEASRAMGRELAGTLALDFEVDLHHDPLNALLGMGSRPPDALVLGRLVDVDARHLVQEVKRFPATRHVRIMIFGGHPQIREGLLEAGASGMVAAADCVGLRDKLFAVLGLRRD